ncbi:MAG: hypothetical protein ACKVOR_00335 [Flavobacteriales bacterium]
MKLKFLIKRCAECAAMLLIVTQFVACKKYKPASYTRKSTVMEQKLPNLKLDLDTASFCQAMGQYETEGGFLVYNPNLKAGGVVNFGSEYGLVIQQYINQQGPLAYSPSLAGQLMSLNQNYFYWPVTAADKSIKIVYNYLPIVHQPKSTPGPPIATSTEQFKTFDEMAAKYPNLARARLNFKMMNVDKAHAAQLDSLKIEKVGNYYTTTFDELKRMPMFNELTYNVQVGVHLGYDNRTSFQFEFLEKEMPKICDTTGAPAGRLELRIVNSKISYGWHWFGLSTATLYTINFLGFPIGSQSHKYTMEANIYNNRNEVVYTKRFKTKGTATSAMYWGYSMTGILSKDCYDCPGVMASSANAIYNTMEDLKVILERDRVVIEQALTK